jgi:hypothetical protein
MKITDVSTVMSGPNLHHVDARKCYESPYAGASSSRSNPAKR